MSGPWAVSGPSPFEALASLGHLRVTVMMECARQDTMRQDAMRHDTMKCS